MSEEANVLTIEKNDLFMTRPLEAERANLREEWRRAVAGSIVKAIKAALTSEGKSDNQLNFLIKSFIEQLDLDSKGLVPELRELFSDPIKLSSLSVGNAIYPFREEAVAAFVTAQNTLVLPASMPADLLRGKGDTLEAAQKDLAIRLHSIYQRLTRLLPSELTEDESFELNAINNLIDCREHEELTPTNRRKIGIVTCRYPFRIKWWGDENELEVDLSTSPCQLAAFGVGDWFDASVEYNRKHKQVMRILTIQRLPPRAEKPYNNHQLAQEMDELGQISPDDI